MNNVNNCRWIQYSQLISRNEWKRRQMTLSSGLLWGYEANVQVQTGHNMEQNYWEKLHFDFLLIPTPQFLKLRICFPWLRGSVIYGSAWFYDYCVVNITLLNQHDRPVYKKYFHVEPESQGCGMVDHSSTEEIAGYQNDKFIPTEDFQRLCAYVPDLEKPDFVPVAIGITMRVHKGYSKDLSLPTIDIKLTFSSHWQPPIGGNRRGKKKLRGNTSTADVAFVLNTVDADAGMDCDLIPAHRAVLAANSPVFEKMFQTHMQEKETGLIQLERDTSSGAVQAFLDFLYDVTPEYFVENIDMNLQVLKLAHKYQVTPLIDLCVQNIVGNPNSALSAKAALDIFSAGCTYDLWDLKYRSAQWVQRNQSKVKTQAEFEELLKFHSESYFSCDIIARV